MRKGVVETFGIDRAEEADQSLELLVAIDARLQEILQESELTFDQLKYEEDYTDAGIEFNDHLRQADEVVVSLMAHLLEHELPVIAERARKVIPRLSPALMRYLQQPYDLSEEFELADVLDRFTEDLFAPATAEVSAEPSAD